MERVLGRYSEYAFALMRMVLGFLFLCHGAQKLGLMDKPRVTAPLMLTAGTIELLGGLLIAIGLFAGTAAFIASGLMAVAYFMAHFPRGFLPLANGGELAVVYCFVFLYIACRGSGTWSLDRLRR